MNPDHDTQLPALPSKWKLAVTTLIAVAVAGVILLTTVLPAEYGIDPLGTGAALGLTAISRSTPPVSEIPVSPGGPALTPVQEGPVARYGAEYKVDSAQFVVGPYEYVEYKYRLEKGASMLYSWTASSTPISDFHGDPDGGGKDSTVSYDKQPRSQAQGMFTAPFSGIHGWYWENPGGASLTVKIASAGFYSAAVEIRMDHTRQPHELTPLDAVTGRMPSPAAPLR